MRIHDDHPGGAGGHPEDQYYGGTSAAAGTSGMTPPPDPAASTRYTAAPADLDYYDDGYSDDGLVSTGWQSDDYYDELGRDGRRELGWNGGTDFGLLILRLALGGVFVAHGAQKLFGAFGGPGLDGFARYLAETGFERSDILALVTGLTEFGGGALLILGLFTPLAAAGLLGVMVNAVAMKFGAGFFASSGGIEYELTLAALALGLLFTGPGRAALDHGRSWFRRPVVAGFVCLVVAAGSSAGVLLVLH